MPDKTQTEDTEAAPVQNDDKDKRSVMDRITDELNNPSEETERRFQEYIANN